MRTKYDAVLTTSEIYEDRSETRGGVYVEGRLQRDLLRTQLVWKSVDPDLLPNLEVQRHLEEAIYCGRFFVHFGHFLIETVPALYWGMNNDRHLVWHPWPSHISITHTRMRMIRFLMDALNITETRMSFVGPHTKVKELMVPPQLNIIEGQSSPLLKTVYSRVAQYAPTIEGSPRKRIYFSRRKLVSNVRHIINEDIVEDIFTKRGFSIVYPETLPIEEQIAIARDAEIIAGIDGSALHLCAFMQTGKCFVLESRKTPPAIEAINRFAGIDTIKFNVCRSERLSSMQKTIVDIDLLTTSLERALS